MRDVLTYHVDTARSGLNSDFAFDDHAEVSSWEHYATIPTKATVRAAPLYVAGYIFLSGPHAGETHDVVIVAASDNMVYAYAEDQLLGL
jgi:hypothetical protein